MRPKMWRRYKRWFVVSCRCLLPAGNILQGFACSHQDHTKCRLSFENCVFHPCSLLPFSTSAFSVNPERCRWDTVFTLLGYCCCKLIVHIMLTRAVARNSFWVGIIFYCTILQSYVLAAWRHRLQLVHKIIFRDWFWEGIYTDIPPVATPLMLTCTFCTFQGLARASLPLLSFVSLLNVYN